MTVYSSCSDIADFLNKIGNAPLFVCDMDGNVMTGYTLKADAAPLPLQESDDPQRQTIPYGTPPAILGGLIKQGAYETGIFAEKSMDARLPAPLVDLVNQGIETNQPFRIAFLTSRGADDARKLLVESGIGNVDAVTLVADSGATLFIQGRKTEARRLNDGEKNFLSNLDYYAAYYQKDVQALVAVTLGTAKGCPKLFVEHKGIASNIHYREILSHFGQPDNSDLDKAIGAHLKERLDVYAGLWPKDLNGESVFKTLDGPATVEVKVASMHKGHGLAAIVEEALGSGVRPSAIVFAGDDVAKGNGLPGTDYYAMAQARNFSAKYKVPFLNIHTHHPIDNDVNGDLPDPDKSPGTLSAAFNKPDIDLVVPTPSALTDIILRAYNRSAPGVKSGTRLLPEAAAAGPVREI